MPLDPELTKIFGDDFTDVFNSAMSKMDDSASLIMQQGLSNAVFDAQKFGVDINKRVAELTNAGIAPDQIKKLIDQDLKQAGRIFGSLKNSTKETLSNGINQTGRAGQFEAYKPTDQLAWVTVGGHKICPDCSSRAGEVHVMTLWEALGLPGSGWSVCRGYCYCILDPTGKIDKEVKLPEKKVKAIKPEKGATIRPKKPSLRDRLRRKFTSQNKAGNEHFVDAFSTADDKMLGVIDNMPELRHISHNKRGGYFTEYRNPNFKYLDKNDAYYQSRHGGINIKTSNLANMKAYRSEVGTIRHEYGHFMHHNLHPYIGKMREIYYLYHDELKKGLSTSVDDFADSYNLNKQARDHLKMHEAYFKSRERLGVSSKYKRITKRNKPLTDKRLTLAEKHDERWNRVRRKQLFKDEIRTEADLAFNKRNPYYKDTDEIIQALIADDTNANLYISDLFGALTDNQIGFGHSTGYYKANPTMRNHEVFANLTALYSNENPVIWKWLKNELPELTTYYEELIDTLNADGYFGIPVKEGFVGLETFKPPLI